MKISSEKLKYLVLFISVIFIVIGFFNGEIDIVFKKAATICLECCGIG